MSVGLSSTVENLPSIWSAILWLAVLTLFTYDGKLGSRSHILSLYLFYSAIRHDPTNTIPFWYHRFAENSTVFLVGAVGAARNQQTRHVVNTALDAPMSPLLVEESGILAVM